MTYAVVIQPPNKTRFRSTIGRASSKLEAEQVALDYGYQREGIFSIQERRIAGQPVWLIIYCA